MRRCSTNFWDTRLVPRKNLPEPPNHERLVIGQPGRLPCPDAMPPALHLIKVASGARGPELIAKSFRLSNRHDIIVGAVDQKKSISRQLTHSKYQFVHLKSK